jgi:hypothetical protein
MVTTFSHGATGYEDQYPVLQNSLSMVLLDQALPTVVDYLSAFQSMRRHPNYRRKSSSHLQYSTMFANEDNAGKKSDMRDLEVTESNEAAHSDSMEITAAQNRRILLKTDLVIMPLAVLCMTLAFLDKVNFSYSN